MKSDSGFIEVLLERISHRYSLGRLAQSSSMTSKELNTSSSSHKQRSHIYTVFMCVH